MDRAEGAKRVCALLAVVAVTSSAPAPVRAAESSGPASVVHSLGRTSSDDLVLETSLAVAALVASTLSDRPTSCEWCEPPGLDERLHTPVSESWRSELGVGMHFVSFGVLPLASMGALIVPSILEDRTDDAWADGVILLNAILLDLALTTGVKNLVARRRPAFFYGREADSEFDDHPSEEFVSFFSSDTSTAFTAVTAATVLAYQRGYAAAPYLLWAGGAAAALVGVSRVAADVHWPSDVLTGAAVGVALGMAYPLLLHPRRARSALALAPFIQGGATGATATLRW